MLMIIIVGIVAFLIVAVFLFWQVYFLRDPEREVGKGIVSPANGTVSRVIRFDGKKVDVPKGLLGQVRVLTKDVAKKGNMVVIVMTPFNVHYQRAPIAGEIKRVEYMQGKFLNAVKDAEGMKASLENENNSILIKKGKDKIKIIQVAGFLARRIECYVKKRQKINKGQTIGRINLGSQVILVLPQKYRIKIKEGQTVVDGETTIAV